VRQTVLKRRPSSSRRRPISKASPEQRRKVKELGFCVVSGFEATQHGPIDPAHIVPRSQGGCDSELCVIPLRRYLHRQFDDGTLDLLPYLHPYRDERRWLPELQHALDHLDGNLVQLLERLAGQRIVWG
jgi:hypothetical protein